MSSDVKIPEWATEEAGKIADVWQHPMHHDHQILSQDIARALLAAEQRGLEKAVEYHNGLAVAYTKGAALANSEKQRDELRDSAASELRHAAAIRSLGDKT